MCSLRWVAALIVVAAMPATRVRAQAWQEAPEDAWRQIFDGRDLAGWKVKLTHRELGEDPLHTVSARDGVMKVSYDEYDRFDGDFGHIFFEEPFSYYVLRLEYRFLGEQTTGGPDWGLRNSGVMFHAQSPESMGREQDFPVCVEAQLLGGTGEGERPTGNVCTPGTNVVMDGRLVTDHCVQSTSATYDGDQWVSFELVVLGSGRIEHRVNGNLVLAYEQPQYGGGNVANFDESVKRDGELIEKGYIALQAESHPVEFRNVRILDLVGCMERQSPSYRPWFVASDPERCKAAD
jgi:3-keto-disaccharide hydrolase